MENATKALLIAAGIFFGLLIITVSLFVFNEISNYYESKAANKVTEEMAKFNKQYTAYNRDDVRGSDILSLVNKIIDFNKSKETEEKEISISISIPKDAGGKFEYFYYKYDDYSYGSDNSVTLIKTKNYIIYDHTNINSKLITPANFIKNKYDGKADKLSANISKIIIDRELTGTSKEREENARNAFLAELNISLVEDKDILKYYQYQQFKRAHFDCKEVKFTDTGRIESFNFEFNGKFE